jgi:hypothetical protein
MHLAAARQLRVESTAILKVERTAIEAVRSHVSRAVIWRLNSSFAK